MAREDEAGKPMLDDAVVTVPSIGAICLLRKHESTIEEGPPSVAYSDVCDFTSANCQHRLLYVMALFRPRRKNFTPRNFPNNFY